MSIKTDSGKVEECIEDLRKALGTELVRDLAEKLRGQSALIETDTDHRSGFKQGLEYAANSIETEGDDV